LGRRAILETKEIATILTDEWRAARTRHGWAIGRYVIMPDHVHFFCRAELRAKALPLFMQRWKEWTSKRIVREATVAGIGDPDAKRNQCRSRRLRLQGIGDPRLKSSGNLWQEEFFDHVLRSSESYSQKWDYVKENPVRAGLVKSSDEWPWQGEIESLML
jgi:putative transposase